MPEKGAIMRRGRTRQSRTGSTPQRHNGCHLGPTSAYAPLSEAEVDKVIDTAVMLLAESGVVFEPGSPAALVEATRRLVRLHADGPAWKSMQKQGMKADVSWQRSAARYAALFRSLAKEGPT